MIYSALTETKVLSRTLLFLEIHIFWRYVLCSLMESILTLI